MFWRAILTCLGLAQPLAACEVALVLAVDVSGSVDPDEYAVQMQGLAKALRDPVISEALVRGNSAVMLMQWTGASRQAISLPWAKMTSFEELEIFAAHVAAAPRVWRNFSTAIGEALMVAEAAFAQAPECKRRIVDVSSDGVSNEGIAPHRRHMSLKALGITVNALVIEEPGGEDLTGYFYENVITGEGAFVVTANGFDDYPARIREKLLREAVIQLTALP